MMRDVKSIAVFCGASSGNNPIFKAKAEELGREMAQRGIRLVYGGGAVGLMGTIADEVMEAGGEVLGVIPKRLDKKEIAHQGISDLRVVNNMHERKQLMAEESDAFIAMPGGFGTFEETFEAITWSQLGIHTKSVGFLNVEEYYTPMIELIHRSVDLGFIKKQQMDIVLDDPVPSQLLEKILHHKLESMDKWLMPDEF